MRILLLPLLAGAISAHTSTLNGACEWDGCEVKASPYYGGFSSILSVDACRIKCEATEGCKHFVWRDFGGCYLYGDQPDASAGYETVVCEQKSDHPPRYVSGSVDCPSVEQNAAEIPEDDDVTIGSQYVTNHTYTRDQYVPKRNLQATAGCFLQKTEVLSDPYFGNPPAATADACQILCQKLAGCAWFVWGNWNGGQCYLKGPKNVRYVDQSANAALFISGPAVCPTCPGDAVYAQLTKAAAGMTISKRGSATWADDSSISNYAIQPVPQPCAVVFCRSEADVQATVKWLKTNKLAFVIRSGRNDYSGFSTLQDGIILDISNLRTMKIDTTKKQAVIGAGVRNAEFYNFLGSQGYCSPGGTGATVGLSGCATGGCIGMLTRTYGIVSDLIVGGRIVLNDGTAKALDANTLFAIRGAGHNNYGVITEFGFNLIKDGKIYVDITKTWDKSQSRATRVSVIKTWQNWEKGSDKRVNSRLVVLTGGTVQVETVCTTDETTCRSLVPSLLVSGAPATTLTSFTDFWLRMASYQCTGVNDCLTVARTPPNKWQQNAWRAGSIFSTKLMSDTLINNVLQEFENFPVPSSGNIYKTYIQFWPDGAAMASKPLSYAAWPYRTTQFHTQLYTSWNGATFPSDYNTRMAFMDRVTATMEAELGSNRYVNYNYKYPGETKQQILQRYYGANLQQLQTIDGSVDPGNFFTYPQAV